MPDVVASVNICQRAACRPRAGDGAELGTQPLKLDACPTPSWGRRSGDTTRGRHGLVPYNRDSPASTGRKE